MFMKHVTIHTARFEEEISFYIEEAGLHTVREIHRPERDIVFLANEKGQTEVEIIRDDEALCSGAVYISIGFETENVDKKREELLAKGFCPTPAVEGGGGARFFFVEDPAGVRVQFI